MKEYKDSLESVFETREERAELLNGRVAMLGVIAAIGAYCVSGQLIPGYF